MTKSRAFVIVLLMFVISVLVRLPNLNRPLSYHQEDIPAMVLICMEAWQQAGGAKHFSYTPVLNYQNEGDKLYGAKNSDKEGNIMYITFGPGWCILPYTISQLFYIRPSPLYLQILNILLHLISCIIFFKIASELYGSGLVHDYLPSLISTVVFIFSPLLLWTMGNAYCPASAALPFELAMIFFFLIMIKDPKKIGTINIFLAFIFTSLTIYCDWIGVFIAAFFGFVFLFLSPKNKKYFIPAASYLFAIPLALAVILIQFSQHAGIQQTGDILFKRFLYRTYGTDGHNIFFITKWAAQIFVTRNFPVLLLMAVSAITLIKRKTVSKTKMNIVKALLISALVLLIHNVVFLGWTAQNDFSTINYLIPFSLLCGLLVYRAFDKKEIFIISLCFFFLCITEYYYFNRPGDFDRKGRPYAEYKELGSQIKEIVRPDEVIFINADPAPQCWYYAKRHYIFVNDVVEAEFYFHRWHLKKCIFINQQDGKIRWYKRIENS